jgi:hypothetical protein
VRASTHILKVSLQRLEGGRIGLQVILEVFAATSLALQLLRFRSRVLVILRVRKFNTVSE